MLQTLNMYQLRHVRNIGQVAFNVAVTICTALLVAKRHFSFKVLSKQSDSNFRNVILRPVNCQLSSIGVKSEISVFFHNITRI